MLIAEYMIYLHLIYIDINCVLKNDTKIF